MGWWAMSPSSLSAWQTPVLPSHTSLQLASVHPGKPEIIYWVLTKLFTTPVWFLIIASYSFMWIIVWYLEHKDILEFYAPWNTQGWATLWLTFSIIFFAHAHSKISSDTFQLKNISEILVSMRSIIWTQSSIAPIFSMACTTSELAPSKLHGYYTKMVVRRYGSLCYWSWLLPLRKV